MSIIHNNVSSEAKYFAPRRLGHVNLWVDDVNRSESFYHNTCGLMVEFTEPDLEATFLGVGHTAHDLGMMRTTNGQNRYGRDGTLQIPGTIGLRVGLNHIAWELENEADLVAAYRRMQQDGLKHDMTMDHQIAHSVYMFDPDGNYNEFYCDTIEDWRSVLHGEMGLISGKWDPEKAEAFKDSRYPSNPILKTNVAAPLHPKRITHLVLETKKFSEMIDFYTRVGGLKIISSTERVAYLRCSMDAYQFGLVLIDGTASCYRHASFEMKSEDSLNQSLEDLGKRGIQVEKLLDLPWKRSLFLRDPDGLMTEWYVGRASPRKPDSVAPELFALAV
jgi:catechol 2,3-dioxygenase